MFTTHKGKAKAERCQICTRRTTHHKTIHGNVYLYRESTFFCIFIQCRAHCFCAKIGCSAMIFRFGKALKSRVFDERKTPLRCLLDAIMMLTFFDAVVIAIATCSYRDSNMMLSSCVHVVINLATCCQVEGASL